MITLSWLFIVCAIITLIIWSWVTYTIVTDDKSGTFWFPIAVFTVPLGTLFTLAVWLIYFIVY